MSEALKNEVVRGNAALSKLNGGDWVKFVMQNDSEMYKRTTDAARDIVLGKLGTGSREPLAEYWKTIEEVMKKRGGSVDEASRRVFDLTMQAITSPKSTPELRETAARQLFGAKDFYSNFNASDETKNAIFAKMTSPQVTAIMAGMRDEGKEDIWGMYSNFIERVFSDRLDRRGADLRDLTSAKEGKGTLVYDPKALMFQRQERAPSGKKELPSPTQFQAEDIRNQRLNRTQAELNLTIRNYAAHLKAQGMSPEQINEAIALAFASRVGFDIQVKSEEKKE
jgi:hypothetical protein